MPVDRTVFVWLVRHPEFVEMYDAAKTKQMEVWGEQIIDLTDNVRADADAVAKAKLQVYARQWVMGKLKPKKYGDSTTIKGDKDSPLTVNIAAALDHAIAQRAAGLTIDHQPAQPMPALSQPLPYETVSADSEENE
jgi:hypothetical protein